MGRKSALTQEQWAEVEHRHVVVGESLNALAKEFGVNESSLRRRIAGKAKEAGPVREQLHELAARKVKAEREVQAVTSEIAALPVVRQMIVSDLARKLSAISNHVASSAELMASASHRLAALMREQIEKVDDADPMKGDSAAALVAAGMLGKLANEAAHIPLNLLKANQATIDAMNKGEDEEVQAGLEHFYGGA